MDGLHSVLEALQHPDRLESVIVCEDYLTSKRATAALKRLPASIPVIETSVEVFTSIVPDKHPQGVAAVVRQQWTRLDDITPDDGLWVALSGVQYPGNLGTILRTCDAVGASGIIVLGNATDPYHPTAVRAGLCAYFTQSIVHSSVEAFAAWLARSRFTVIGASADGEKDYRRTDYRLPMILMMGSEGQGLEPSVRALCDELVAIPMRGQNDSLNLAVATGIVLYEVLEQTAPT